VTHWSAGSWLEVCPVGSCQLVVPTAAFHCPDDVMLARAQLDIRVLSLQCNLVVIGCGLELAVELCSGSIIYNLQVMSRCFCLIMILAPHYLNSSQLSGPAVLLLFWCSLPICLEHPPSFHQIWSGWHLHGLHGIYFITEVILHFHLAISYATYAIPHLVLVSVSVIYVVVYLFNWSFHNQL
jgi:hypothetical protein